MRAFENAIRGHRHKQRDGNVMLWYFWNLMPTASARTLLIIANSWTHTETTFGQATFVSCKRLQSSYRMNKQHLMIIVVGQRDANCCLRNCLWFDNRCWCDNDIFICWVSVFANPITPVTDGFWDQHNCFLQYWNISKVLPLISSSGKRGVVVGHAVIGRPDCRLMGIRPALFAFLFTHLATATVETLWQCIQMTANHRTTMQRWS